MNDQPPCKIEGAEISDPASYSPDPVGKRIIDKGCPEDEEDKIGLELKSFGKCACDQGGCDHGKHHLKDHECLMGDGGRIIGEGVKSHTSQPDPIKASDDMADVRSEGKAISIEDPLDGDDSEGDKALHDRSEDILASDHTSVKKGKSGCHEHDQGRRD